MKMESRRLPAEMPTTARDHLVCIILYVMENAHVGLSNTHNVQSLC